MININSRAKHIECFLDYMEMVSIREHRVNFSISYTDALGHASIRIDLVSRHRNRTSEDDLCVPAEHDLTCVLENCFAQTTPQKKGGAGGNGASGTSADAQELQAVSSNGQPNGGVSGMEMRYECQDVKCSSCGDVEGTTTCSPMIGAMAKQMAPPISFVFTDSDPDQ